MGVSRFVTALKFQIGISTLHLLNISKAMQMEVTKFTITMRGKIHQSKRFTIAEVIKKTYRYRPFC